MANGYARYSGFGSGGGGGGGVTSLNGETGALTLLAGTGITITPVGTNITIAATGAELVFADSLVNTGGTVTLVNDSATPGNTKYYGTNSGGTLGYFSFPTSGTVTSVSVVTANGLAGTVATATTTPAITLSTTITGILQGNGTAISAATTGNLTDVGTDGIVITGGTGAVLGSGTSIAQAAASASQNGYLSSTNFTTFNNKLTSTLTSGDIFVGNGSNVATAVAMSGDATLANTGALTLATVNSNTGSFGSTTAIPNFTVNGKGLITAAGTNVVIAPAGTLSGTTLNSTVVSSSLTSVGTLTTGTWNATTIAVVHGGTGLSTTPTDGQLLIGSTSGSNYSLSTLTAGSGVTITNGSGSITIASSGSGGSAFFAASNVVNTQSTGIATTSFATFSNSPAFTFTPTVSGTYKIYAGAVGYLTAGAMVGSGSLRIYNTSGGATLLEESDGFIYPSTLSVSDTSFIQSVYTLTAGTSYQFDIQGLVSTTGGPTIYLGNNVTGSQFYVFAEQVATGTAANLAMGAFGSTPNANAGSISASTLTLQPADGTHPGGVSTTTQTFGGAKTFSSNVTLSGTGNAVGTITSGTWNGSVTAGNSFLTSGTTYTTPANITSATQFKFTIVGGGAAGAGNAATANAKGAGGGAGGTCIVYLTGLAPSTGYTYAIGSGGTGASAASGSAGGSTSISINAVTYSGNAGAVATVGVSQAGGQGGATSNATIGISGQNGGGVGTAGATTTSGAGGNSLLGLGGGASSNAAVTGLSATGFGGGGGGSSSGSSPTAEAGGNGSAGCILVEWQN